jgi:hypothetical protein
MSVYETMTASTSFSILARVYLQNLALLLYVVTSCMIGVGGIRDSIRYGDDDEMTACDVTRIWFLPGVQTWIALACSVLITLSLTSATAVMTYRMFAWPPFVISARDIYPVAVVVLLDGLIIVTGAELYAGMLPECLRIAPDLVTTLQVVLAYKTLMFAVISWMFFGRKSLYTAEPIAL